MSVGQIKDLQCVKVAVQHLVMWCNARCDVCAAASQNQQNKHGSGGVCGGWWYYKGCYFFIAWIVAVGHDGMVICVAKVVILLLLLSFVKVTKKGHYHYNSYAYIGLKSLFHYYIVITLAIFGKCIHLCCLAGRKKNGVRG